MGAKEESSKKRYCCFFTMPCEITFMFFGGMAAIVNKGGGVSDFLWNQLIVNPIWGSIFVWINFGSRNGGSFIFEIIYSNLYILKTVIALVSILCLDHRCQMLDMKQRAQTQLMAVSLDNFIRSFFMSLAS